MVSCDSGNYYLKNFTPANYMSTDQNRGFVQDSIGRLFVANLSGVLIYDGYYWEIALLKNESALSKLFLYVIPPVH